MTQYEKQLDAILRASTRAERIKLVKELKDDARN